MTTERTVCCFCLGSCKTRVCLQCSATAQIQCVIKYIGTVTSTTEVCCPLCRGNTLQLDVQQPNTRLRQRILDLLNRDIKNINRSASYTAEKHFHSMMLHIIEHFSVLRRDLTLMIALKEKLMEAIVTWHQRSHKYMDLFYQIFETKFSYEPPMFLVVDLTAQLTAHYHAQGQTAQGQTAQDQTAQGQTAQGHVDELAD